MRRFPHHLRYTFRSTLRGLRASPVPGAISALTIGLSLLIVGSFALLVTNMQGLVDRFGRDLRVIAYLEDDLPEERRAELAERLATVEGVGGVELVTKAEALRRFREGAGGRVDLLEGLDENPLPASLEIVLVPSHRTPEGIRRVVQSVDGLPGVEEMGSSYEWVEGYARALGVVRAGTLGLGGILVLAALLIVQSTIRLAVYARQDEIEILSLVGAGRGFVRIPFVLEGFVQGGVGGLLALGCLAALFHLALPGFREGLSFVLGFVEPRFFDPIESLGLVAAGAVLGAVGSGLALSTGVRS